LRISLLVTELHPAVAAILAETSLETRHKTRIPLI
jgi:hypothetical protein